MGGTVERLLAIDGNQAVYDALAQSLNRREAIGFAGAGASAGMYPLWTSLISNMADFAVESGRAAPSDAIRWKSSSASPQRQVDLIRRSLGDALYWDYLRRTFASRKNDDGNRFTPI